MMDDSHKIKCLFGYHEYTAPRENNPHILMCHHCYRSGYYRWPDGFGERFEYDEEDNVVGVTDSVGNTWKYNNVHQRLILHEIFKLSKK